MDGDVKELKEQSEKLKERVDKLQNLAWVLGTLAVVLGLGGANVWTQLSSIRAEATNLKGEMTALEKNVTTYRKEAQDARDNLTNALKPIVTAEVENARVSLQSARNAAIANIQNQQKTSSALLQKQISVGDKCSTISSLQVCWGVAEVKPDPKAPHTAAFSFSFERPFRRTPAIVNGINVMGSGHALGVYSWGATPSEYKGRLNNMYLKDPIKGVITMQYIAIGPAI